jgi:tetratricopeptide (TPR) repeat protein
VLTAVVFVAAAPLAWAEADVDAARAAAERGRREYNLGHWQQSIDGFEKAYQLSGDATLLFNLGLAHTQLGHIGEALRFYRTYLREKPDAPNRDIAEKQIKELEAQAGRETARPAAAPKPASVPTIPPPPPNGPPPSAVHPAPVTPPATTPGAAGPAPPPSAPVALPSTTAPGPAVAASPPPAANVITAAPTPPPPARHAPLPAWLPLVGALLTIASTTGAIVYGLSASHSYDDLKTTCGQTVAGCTADQIDGVKSHDRAATILWVSAGVLAAATGVTVYVNTRAAGAAALWRF